MHATEKSSQSSALSLESLVPLAWVLAAAIGICELWLFAERFSTDALELSRESWAPLVRAARFHTPWCLCVLSVIALAGGRVLRSELQGLPATTAKHTTGLAAFLVHLAALWVFYLCTEELLECPAEHGGWRGALPIAWISSGSCAAFYLWSIVFPARCIRATVWRLRVSIVLGVFGGTVVYVVGAFLWTTWPFWEMLARATLWLSDCFVGIFASERVYDQAAMVLGTESFPVHVTRYCSGYEGIALFLVFFTFFLIFCRERLRFPRALILVPLGCIAVWILNAVRIALLIGIGTLVSPDVAIEGFHVYAGWPFVAVGALSAVVISTRVRWFDARSDVPRNAWRTNSTAAYLGPFLAIVASSMLCGAMTTTPEALYPVRIAAAVCVLWFFRNQYSELTPSFAWSSVAWGVVCAALWLAGGFASETFLSARDPHTWQASAPPASIAMWWCARTLGFVVIAPIAEELAFRGYLARRLARSEFESVDPRALSLPSCAISALCFGLAHDAWAPGLAVGLVFALLYRRRGRLLDACLCHATANALLAGFALTTGQWWAWS